MDLQTSGSRRWLWKKTHFWLVTPRNLTVCPWKMVVGWLLSYLEGIFSGAMLNFRWVMILIPYHSTPATPPDGVKIWLCFFMGHLIIKGGKLISEWHRRKEVFVSSHWIPGPGLCCFAAGHADFKDFNDFSRFLLQQKDSALGGRDRFLSMKSWLLALFYFLLNYLAKYNP